MSGIDLDFDYEIYLRPLEQVTYFILRGEWQKVWYRNKYQNNS